MAQFDVYSLPNDQDMLFVDLQSGAVDEFNTRLMAPLLPLDPRIKPLRRVNRELTFGPRTYLFMPQLMSAVRMRDLGKPLGNIQDQRDRIVSALDVLFVGI
jgi:toxin CcdB